MKQPRSARRRWFIGLAVALAIVVLVGVLGPAFASSTPPAKSLHAKVAVGNLVSALKAYQIVFHTYPEGNHREILRALLGSNRNANVFINVQSKRINQLGEYLDPWGTPYHIGYNKLGELVVYSFGPNRQDDQASKESDDFTAN